MAVAFLGWQRLVFKVGRKEPLLLMLVTYFNQATKSSHVFCCSSSGVVTQVLVSHLLKHSFLSILSVEVVVISECTVKTLFCENYYSEPPPSWSSSSSL